MIKLSELIKVPISVGDTVLGGKFKNKRIKVKSIGKNDKGDITINNKPMMKVRLIPKSDIDFPEGLKEGKEELYKLYTQAMKMMPGSPKQKELIKKITKVRKKLKMERVSSSQILASGLGPSDEARRYMMLQLYGSNFVTNYKRLLNGIKNEKTGVIKKSWKDFQAIYNQIEKEIKQII